MTIKVHLNLGWGFRTIRFIIEEKKLQLICNQTAALDPHPAQFRITATACIVILRFRPINQKSVSPQKITVQVTHSLPLTRHDFDVVPEAQLLNIIAARSDGRQV